MPEQKNKRNYREQRRLGKCLLTCPANPVPVSALLLSLIELPGLCAEAGRGYEHTPLPASSAAEAGLFAAVFLLTEETPVLMLAN